MLTRTTKGSIITVSKERNLLMIKKTKNEIKKRKGENKMAKNWMAYEAAEVLLMGNNVEEIAEVGSRYPLFTRVVSMANSRYILDLLKAIPKTTARVIETGLKDMGEGVEETETEETQEETPKKAPKKEAKAKAKKEKEEDVEESENDYESMTSKDLYKLCCDRGISSKCKKRDKATLIAVLRENDGAETEAEEHDSWDDEEDENPYAGKTARELYKMCCDRGIKAKTKQSADDYVKLLKKADEAEAEVEEDEDDDDDWEI